MAAQSYDRLEGVIWYDGKLVPWAPLAFTFMSAILTYFGFMLQKGRQRRKDRTLKASPIGPDRHFSTAKPVIPGVAR